MKTITVRDVRQRWLEAERALAIEREIVITRDGKPVARLLPVEPEEKPGKRFDPEENRRWMEEIWGKDTVIDSLSAIQADREERKLLRSAER